MKNFLRRLVSGNLALWLLGVATLAMPAVTLAQAPVTPTPPQWPAPTPEDDLVLVGDLLFRIPRWLDAKASSIERFRGETLFNFRKTGDRSYTRLGPHGTYAKDPFKSWSLSINMANVPPWKMKYGFDVFISYEEQNPRTNPTCSVASMIRNNPGLDENKITDPTDSRNYYFYKGDPYSDFTPKYIFLKSKDFIFNRELVFLISKEWEPWEPKEYERKRQYNADFYLSEKARIGIRTSDFRLNGYPIFDASRKVEKLLNLLRVKEHNQTALWPHALGECPVAKP